MVLRAWIDRPSGRLRVRITDRPGRGSGGSQVVVASGAEVCHRVQDWLNGLDEAELDPS